MARLTTSVRRRAVTRDVRTASTGWSYTPLRTPLHAFVNLSVSVKSVVSCPIMMPQSMDTLVATVKSALRHRISRTR